MEPVRKEPPLNSPMSPADRVAEMGAVHNRARQLVARFGKYYPSTCGKKSWDLVETMVELCFFANPLQPVDYWRRALKKLTPRRRFALYYLYDKSQGGVTPEEVAGALELSPVTIYRWIQEPIFAYILQTLTLGYSKRVLEPLVYEVVVEGLNRRYVEDQHNKDTGELITKAGTRIFDGVTASLVREAKGLLGLATDVTKSTTPQVTPEEEARQKKQLAEFMTQNPEIVHALRSTVGNVEKELPKTDVKEVTAVDCDGTLKESDAVQP